jgi:hypothetical protein
MSGQRSNIASGSLWRLAVVGGFLAVAGVSSLLWQGVTQAGGGALEARTVAVVKDKQLQLAVLVGKDPSQRLTGTLAAELIGPGGERLADARKELESADGWAVHGLTLTPVPASLDQARLRISFGGRQTEVPLAHALLAKGHETILKAGTELNSGGLASLYCSVHGVRSVTDTVPLPGSAVVVQLRDKDGKSHELFKGRTGSRATPDFEFTVPSIEAGNYTLEIVTRSPLGEEKIERGVRVAADAKIMLVSDRPIYQPGHVIHLRALVLRPFDMRPVADKDLLFEVEDPKGNKVFKRTFKTSDFGVASVDFQLADEVNMGDYHLRAVLGDTRAEKTVQVKRYVLPKFKVAVKADKAFYLPKETVKLDIQSDYFFGKPVAEAKVEVTASTFDVAFNKFHAWRGETDANGHTKLEIKLPDYFVGQPLQKGDALVKFDVKVLDSADHTENAVKTYPVSDQPVRISLIAEGGKIVPDMANRIFVAATYPDGSPSPNCEIKLWHQRMPDAPVMPMRGGRGGFQPVAAPGVPGPAGPPPADEKIGDPKSKLLGTVTTNEAGLAEIKVTPKAEDLRTTGWGQQTIELLGGKQMRFGANIAYDVRATAKDPRGNAAQMQVALNSHPLGENVLLRLDKAIYQAGDRLGIDVRTSAGLPTVYLDIVRGGQIMLSKWLDVKDGKATQTLDLPPAIFGSLEIHAYQMLHHGEIIRDSRVVYVQPRNDLKVSVQPGKAEFEPGEDGMIRFRVTDAQGKPTAAAIGVIVVDEAVYALQDLQPGLEKVYFTLQEELLKPQAQIKLSPGDTLDNLVVQPALPAPRQQVAEVLLTAVKLPAPKRMVVDPVQERRQRVEGQLQNVANVIFNYALQANKDAIVRDKGTGRWAFKAGLLDEMVKANNLPAAWLDGGLGVRLTLDDLAGMEKSFTPENLGRAITTQRMQQMVNLMQQYINTHKNRVFFDGDWFMHTKLIDDVLADTKQPAFWGRDAWGQPLQVVRLAAKVANSSLAAPFDQYDLVSPGPDGRLLSNDDVRLQDVIKLAQTGMTGVTWWMPAERRREFATQAFKNRQLLREDRAMDFRFGLANGAGGPPPGPGGFGGGGLGAGRGGPPAPRAAAPAQGFRGPEKKDAAPMVETAKADTKATGGSEAPRVREFFPETMLWQPALITDDKGEANLALSFADSITTWRLSASANARTGAIGGTTLPLKVFQDFFVDIDLPVSLTQGDEITFPVAVYNYLKTPQTVKIELEKEPWFELLDAGGLVRSLDVKPGDVTNVKFRIRAGKIGMQPLNVKAIGSKKSDAVKRLVEVVPNGQKIEKVASDRLKGTVTQVIDIPANAVPDASKLIVRIYPGVMAQVLEGVEGLIRLPGG